MRLRQVFSLRGPAAFFCARGCRPNPPDTLPMRTVTDSAFEGTWKEAIACDRRQDARVPATVAHLQGS
jgi:hypothetical protein